ncbi:20352_t:CDS:1, partial [Funneliformis geosporum]
MSELNIIFYDPNPQKDTKKKKRVPNSFILFRREALIDETHNIKMTRHSRLASIEWNKLSEYEKANWQRKSQMMRDQGKELPRKNECPSCGLSKGINIEH